MVGAMRRILAVLAMATLLLSACAQEIALPDDADDELRSGAEVFRARCARCHGPDGGGGIGKSLRGVAERLTDEEQLVLIMNGKGTMPRFDSVLSDADMTAVIRYTREILSGPPTG